LADPTRRRVLERVAVRPRAVGEIAMLLPVSRPAVSQHLRALKDAGLVRESRDGTRRIYRADPAALEALRRYLDDLCRAALGAAATTS
jgi:DNA-binding transcriptional ArsR family regulator